MIVTLPPSYIGSWGGLYNDGHIVASSSSVKGSFVKQEVLKIVCFMTEVFKIVTLMPKVPVVVLMLLMFSIIRDAAHFLSCVIIILLKLGEPKNLILALLDMLVNSFEVVDLPI